MPNTPIEKIDISGYSLLPVLKNSEGVYPFPRTRYGVLPYYQTKDKQIFWGLIETNRFGPITLAPAAGTQDIIAIKNDERLILESSKPLPEVKIEGIHVGEAFREQVYQDTLHILVDNGFDIYFENPLATAIHEAYEEHGIDLAKDTGRNLNLLHVPLEKTQYIQTPEQKTMATQHLWIAELSSPEGVILIHTNKVDMKVRRNFGRSFYEKGCWRTLDDCKILFHKQQAQYFSSEHNQLAIEALNLFEHNIKILENYESSLFESMQSSATRFDAHVFFKPFIDSDPRPTEPHIHVVSS